MDQLYSHYDYVLENICFYVLLYVQWDPLIRKSSGPDFRFSYKRALF